MTKKICRIAIPVALYVAAMTIFAFFDLDISIALFDKESLFAKIFEAIAEVPFTFIALMSFTVLFLTRNKAVKRENILIATVSVAGMLAYGFLMPFFVLNYLKVDGALIYGFVLMPPNCAASYFALRILCKKYGDRLKTVAIIAVLTILAEQLLINVLKFAWGRPRMRDLASPYTDFRPWYLPDWFGGADSFPSGHSANAACVVIFTLLPDIFSKRKKVGCAACTAICYLWLVTVMIARIVAGAHFASDVTAGAAVTLCIFYSLKSVFAPDSRRRLRSDAKNTRCREN